MQKIYTINLLIIALMSGCASLSKEECLTGNWYGIGMADGAKGRTPAYFQQHIKSCSKHGVNTSAGLWEKGRKEGLKHYCTADNAYYIGKQGDAFSPVCYHVSASMQATINKRHQQGTAVYKLEKEISKQQTELADLKKQLKDKQSKTRSRYQNDSQRSNRSLKDAYHANFSNQGQPQSSRTNNHRADSTNIQSSRGVQTSQHNQRPSHRATYLSSNGSQSTPKSNTSEINYADKKLAILQKELELLRLAHAHD